MQRFEHEPTEEDAEQILMLAARKTTDAAQVRDRMRRAAAELGISEADLEAAEREFLAQKAQSEELEEYREYRLRGWKSHLISYVCVNLMLFAINMLTSPREIWFIFPLLGWGIGMAIHTAGALQRRVHRDDPEFQDWLAKRRNLG